MTKRIRIQVIMEVIILVVMAYVVLWKGGKSLSPLWILVLSASTIGILGSKDVKKIPLLIWWSGIVFVLLTILSFITSSARNYGFDEVLQTTSLILILFWIIRTNQPESRFRSRFMRVGSGLLLIACLIGIAVYVLQPVNRFVGTFFDYRFHTDYWPNAWAEAILLLWPFLMWVLFFRKTGKKSRYGDLIKAMVIGLVFGCLLLSYSRGGFIAFLGQLFLFSILGYFLRIHADWKRLVKIGITTLIVAVVVFSGINHLRGRYYPVESVGKKVTFSSEEGASSVSERKGFGLQAISMAQKKPLSGFGPYSFRFIQPHLQTEVLATSDHPHNMWLKIAAERGIPAALVLLTLVFSLIIFGFKAFARSRDPALAMLLISSMGVLAHNMIDYNLQFQGIAFPFWIVLGLIVYGQKVTKPPVFHRLAEVLLSVILVVFSLSEGVYLFYSYEARRAESIRDYSRALQWYEKTDYALFPRDQWLARGVINLEISNFNEAEKDVEIYLSSNREDARAWRLKGDILLKTGDLTHAFDAYEKAYVYGRFNDIGITKGYVYLARKTNNLKNMKKDVDLLINEFGLAVEQNVHFIAFSKNVEDLIGLCDLMSKIYPENKGEYVALSKEVERHASEERSRYSVRARGFIW